MPSCWLQLKKVYKLCRKLLLHRCMVPMEVVIMSGLSTLQWMLLHRFLKLMAAVTMLSLATTEYSRGLRPVTTYHLCSNWPKTNLLLKSARSTSDDLSLPSKAYVSALRDLKHVLHPARYNSRLSLNNCQPCPFITYYGVRETAELFTKAKGHCTVYMTPTEVRLKVPIPLFCEWHGLDWQIDLGFAQMYLQDRRSKIFAAHRMVEFLGTPRAKKSVDIVPWYKKSCYN